MNSITLFICSLLKKNCVNVEILLYLQNSTAAQQKNNSLSSPINQQKTKNDILNDIFESKNDSNIRLDDDDDFNPRENTQSFVQPQNANLDFGDFTSAFNNPATKAKDNNDEFADFTSAFSSVTVSNPPSQTQLPQSQINLIGATIPTMNNPVVNNVNINSSLYANTQTADTTFTGTTQNSRTSNNLFDSLSPQNLNNQLTNNNTGMIIN